MKTVLDRIEMEQYKFEYNNVLAKLNKTYVSGDFEGVLEFNFEFRGFNGSTKKIKLLTKENTPDIIQREPTADVIQRIGKNDILSFNDVKKYILYLFRVQFSNMSLFKNYLHIIKSNEIPSNVYQTLLVNDNWKKMSDSFKHIHTNMLKLFTLLTNNKEFNSFYTEMFNSEIQDMERLKTDILEFFNIDRVSRIKSRQKDNYLKRLQILSNLVNDNIYHFNNTLEEYLGDTTENTDLSNNLELDFNLYVINGYNVVRPLDSLDFKSFLNDINSLKYGRVCKDYVKVISNKFAKEYMKINSTSTNVVYDKFNYDFLTSMCFKSVVYPFIFNIDEILSTEDKYDFYNIGIYDFEVYYNDFNVSFIKTNLHTLSLYNSYKNKLEKLKASKDISKSNEIAILEQEVARYYDIINMFNEDIVNDVFKLNTFMGKLHLLVGFNSFFYDNSILFGKPNSFI